MQNPTIEWKLCIVAGWMRDHRAVDWPATGYTGQFLSSSRYGASFDKGLLRLWSDVYFRADHHKWELGLR